MHVVPLAYRQLHQVDPFVQHFAGAEHRAVILHDALHFQAQLRRSDFALGMAQLVDPVERDLLAAVGNRPHRFVRIDDLGAMLGRRTAEDNEIEQ